MRIEVWGAELTDTVVDVIEDLQTQPEKMSSYKDAIDSVTRTLLASPGVPETPELLTALRTLQQIRSDLMVIATPPDINDPANEKPTVSI